MRAMSIIKRLKILDEAVIAETQSTTENKINNKAQQYNQHTSFNSRFKY